MITRDDKGKGPLSMEVVALHSSVAFSFVIPSEAEGSAVPRTPPGNVGNSEIRVRTYAQMEPPVLLQVDRDTGRNPQQVLVIAGKVGQPGISVVRLNRAEGKMSPILHIEPNPDQYGH